MAHSTIRRAAQVLAAAVVMVGPISAIMPAAAEKVLRIANMAEPETLDPHKSSTVDASNILRNLFEGLMVLDPSGNVAPGVAESFSISEDGLTYSFRLRSNAKWSNGEPVTAYDFVYSLRRIEDPKTHSQYAEVLYPIKNAQEVNTGKAAPTELGVAASGPGTVEITLKAPTPYFLQLLTHTSALPVNERAVTRFGDEWLKPGNMASNGAYMLGDVKPNSHVRIVKNPNYWDAAKITIDAAVFDPSEDRAGVLKRYRAGEFDVLRDLPNDQLAWLRQNMPQELHIAPYAGVYFYALNTTKPPFNDKRVRLALSMAINREILVEKITAAGELPAYGFVPDGTANYTPRRAPWRTMSQAQRETAAQKLLSEAGYGPNKPLRFELAYNTSENHKRIAIALAAMWKKLNVSVELVNTEWKVHLSNMRIGNFQMGREGWIADYNDAQSYLFLLQTSTRQQNYSRFSNPEYDRLMDEASVTADAGKRAALLEQAEGILLEEMPVIPIYFYVSKNLVSTKVKGWQDNPLDAEYLRNLSLAEQ
ncbi:MAG TPA: peptide ABC transporter substrate-binding protein [Xanthobacteraceae bacterium]|jgi:ABC-type oligopeptide transport system substrate-binding subunit|nr:peptide ABC transporter substrate-binding protein [Xanthobacteraceae bacterium]